MADAEKAPGDIAAEKSRKEVRIREMTSDQWFSTIDPDWNDSIPGTAYQFSNGRRILQTGSDPYKDSSYKRA